MAAAKPVEVGDIAPDFALPSPTGATVRLSDFRGKSEVVLFFYPKDNSPACTAEACSFRDSFEDFQHAGATVIGISGDSEASHRLFARLWKLPFILLSDTQGEVRDRYGVPRTLGLFPGRVSYLIDREGTIRHIFSSALQPWKHVTEMLRKIGELKAAST
jgi:peroxiredoxin Q/BCP